MNWLDTQTQELLQGDPPSKLAPPKTSEFGLVLLQRGADQDRLVRAISRINDGDESAAASLAGQSPPVTINADLDYADALLGQFELICCDATAAFLSAAFLSAAVLEEGERNYLESLFVRITQSPEFRPCRVTIHHIPKAEGGLKFADQFLGISEGEMPRLVLPLHLEVPFKKARIMKHWARRVGVLLSCDGAGSTLPDDLTSRQLPHG